MTNPAPPPARPADPLAALDADDYVLAFTPVPTKPRHDGWTPDRQRRFVLALRHTGVIAVSARAVGCSPQSAYKLRTLPGAAGFADAWDRALAEGRGAAIELAFDRAVNGYLVPRFYRGQLVGTVRRYDYRLALAALRATEPPQQRRRRPA